MIGIGVIRADLVRDQEAHDRLVRILHNGAVHDGVEMPEVVVFNPDTVDLMLTVLARYGPEVTAYAAQRSHVHDVIDPIRERAGLTLVLDDIAWPRTPRLTA